MFRHQLTVIFASLFLLFVAPALSQNLLQSGPPCVQNCPALGSNEYFCVPPPNGNAAAASMTVYKNCFCDRSQQAVLAAPTTYCSSCTSAAEAKQLVSWINSYCDTTSTTSTSAASSSMPTLGTSSVPNHAAKPTHHANSGQSHSSHKYPAYKPKPKGSWWDQHGKWIIMVIILVLGFSVITVLGVYYKRRYDRRHNATSAPTSNESWGPNTTQYRSSSVYEADEAAQLSSVQEKRSSFRSMQEKRRMNAR